MCVQHSSKCEFDLILFIIIAVDSYAALTISWSYFSLHLLCRMVVCQRDTSLFLLTIVSSRIRRKLCVGSCRSWWVSGFKDRRKVYRCCRISYLRLFTKCIFGLSKVYLQDSPLWHFLFVLAFRLDLLWKYDWFKVLWICLFWYILTLSFEQKVIQDSFFFLGWVGLNFYL